MEGFYKLSDNMIIPNLSMLQIQPVQGDAQPVPHGRLLGLPGAEDVSGQGRVRHRGAVHVNICPVPSEVCLWPVYVRI